ncbi:MAG: RidA family protein [Alphaproteobacteria bacterium]|nr:RidA family protein [Alphaproteobacteria bacterium]
MERRYYEGTWQKKRAFSPVVATRGGRMVFAAGHGAPVDADGNSLAGDFDAQVHESFRLLAASLAQAESGLTDLVSMTVFIIDARYGDRFTELRARYFPRGRYPASAMVTVKGFAQPEMMVEIQGVAVADDHGDPD